MPARFDPAADVVAIDVGGTTIKGARFGSTGPGEVVTEPTPTDGERARTVVRDLAARLSVAQTTAIGVVVPGLIDEAGGVVRFAANLGWHDVALRAELQVATGHPVALGHDVTAAARAEQAESGASDLLFVSVGTGIAAAHVVEGTPRRGARGWAGELGHVPVGSLLDDGEPERCGCGGRGCLERVASAAAIARRYAARTGQAAEAHTVARQRAHDPVAAAVWAEAGAALGEALATATALLDPGEIVLGGGLAEAGEALLTPVRAALVAALPWRVAPEVRRARLGPLAGLYGAAAAARALVVPGVAVGSRP